MHELDERLRRALDRKETSAQRVQRDAPIQIHLWLESYERWQVPLYIAVETALRWFAQSPDDDRVWFALHAVIQAGNRSHLQQLETALQRSVWVEEEQIALAIGEARFDVRRRTLD